MTTIKTSSFTRLKTDDFTVYARSCVNMVSARPDLFSEIEPPVQVVLDSVISLTRKAALASKGTLIQKNERDAERVIVTRYLRMWTGLVAMIAARAPSRQQQLGIVIAAGFQAAYNTGYIRKRLVAVKNLRAKSLSRAILLEFARVKNARTYIVMKTSGYPTEQSVWTTIEITTRARVVIPCEPAEVASFKVYPIGREGRGPGSAIVTCLAGL